MTKPERILNLKKQRRELKEKLNAIKIESYDEEAFRSRNILDQKLRTVEAKIENLNSNLPLLGYRDTELSIIKSK